MDKLLEKLYFDPSTGYASAKNLHKRALKFEPGITLNQITAWLNKQRTYTLHKYARKKYARLKVLTSDIDEQWQLDLVDLTSLQKYNDGYKFLLNCIDVFSKFAWSVPTKNKTGSSVLSAFEKILESGRKPQKIQTDAGTEFLNKSFIAFLQQAGIGSFVTNSEMKASVVERFNRTLKEKMFKYFTQNNTNKYINVLPKLLHAYNTSKHRTIGMAPCQVNDANKAQILEKAYKPNKKIVQFKFKVGDKVRISKVKGHFEKGYLPNWSEEIFIVHECRSGDPPVYVLKDQLGEILSGVLYEPEMQRVDKIDDIYIIEKIIKQRKMSGKTEYFVKWRGYPDKFNSWVTNLIKL